MKVHYSGILNLKNNDDGVRTVHSEMKNVERNYGGAWDVKSFEDVAHSSIISREELCADGALPLSRENNMPCYPPAESEYTIAPESSPDDTNLDEMCTCNFRDSPSLGEEMMTAALLSDGVIDTSPNSNEMICDLSVLTLGTNTEEPSTHSHSDSMLEDLNFETLPAIECNLESAPMCMSEGSEQELQFNTSFYGGDDWVDMVNEFHWCDVPLDVMTETLFDL